MAAYADDLAINLEDPLNSYKALKEELDHYAEVAGMKINYNKTKTLIKNKSVGDKRIK